MKEVANIKTKIGTLVVTMVDSNDYPGFLIALKTENGNIYDPVLVEVDQYGGTEPRLRCHVWDMLYDDPAFEMDKTADEIDEYFEEVSL